MRTAKKIVFIVIALLPFVTIIASVASTIGNDTQAAYVPMGTITFTETAEGVEWATEPETWCDRLMTPLLGENPLTGFYGALARLALYMQTNAGITVSFPLFGSIIYLAYLAWVAMAEMLVDFVTFVPRKCAEIFK